jgi:NADPH:quinone reductase-like Zn-dependent oxidoreductase
VRSLGADQVIDYSKTDFSTAIKDIDLVFDLIGATRASNRSQCSSRAA